MTSHRVRTLHWGRAWEQDTTLGQDIGSGHYTGTGHRDRTPEKGIGEGTGQRARVPDTGQDSGHGRVGATPLDGFSATVQNAL